MVSIIFLLMTLVGISPVNAQVTYSYTNIELLQQEFVENYPQNAELFDRFNRVLEEARIQISTGEYREASQMIRREIRGYDYNTKNPRSLTLLSTLIRMDAAIDMYLLNDKRSGANKNYVMSYILGRFKRFSRDKIDLDHISFIDRMSIIGNGYIVNDASAFTAIATKAYDSLSIYSYYEGLIEKENEYVCCYYEIHDRSESGAGAVWPELMYDYLVRDLFIMSDYKSDIRLYCNSKEDVREACEKAASYSRGEPVPILDSPYYGVHVAVTYRKAKAAEFFKQYYGD